MEASHLILGHCPKKPEKAQGHQIGPDGFPKEGEAPSPGVWQFSPDPEEVKKDSNNMEAYPRLLRLINLPDQSRNLTNVYQSCSC